MLAALEAKIVTYWDELTGEARTEIQKELDAAKTELAKVEADAKALAPMLTQFKADAEAALVAAEPGVKTALEGLLTKLLADAGSVLGGLPAGM